MTAITTDVIQRKLAEIEKAESVRILYSLESGSRAWGFASPDSDYDVRFIYIRPKEYYLRLDKTRDVIEWQLDETLDINGWDIQKALRLVHHANPTLFEWIASPIVYKTTAQWEDITREIMPYFNKKPVLYHYLSTAARHYKEQLSSEYVRLKSYFYVLRPVLACKWILAEGTPPPVPFSQLADKYLDASMKPTIQQLLKMKINTPELGKEKRIELLHQYLEKNMQDIQNEIRNLPAEESIGWDDLNRLFLSLF